MDEDRELLLRLVPCVGVVMHNFRPGVMERLGSGYDDLAAHSGPAEAPPVALAIPIVDAAAGFLLAFTTVSAVLDAYQGGRGRRVAGSLLGMALLMQCHQALVTLNTYLRYERSTSGLAAPWTDAPYGIYRTADGHFPMFLVASNKLALVFDLPAHLHDLIEKAVFAARDELVTAIKPQLLTRTTNDWLTSATQHAIFAAPILPLGEILRHEQVAANRYIEPNPTPDGGTVRCGRHGRHRGRGAVGRPTAPSSGGRAHQRYPRRPPRPPVQNRAGTVMSFINFITIEHELGAIGTRLLRWRQCSYYWGDAIAFDGLLHADDLLAGGWAVELAGRLTRWATHAVDSFDDALAPGQAAARLVAAGYLDQSVLDRIVAALTRLELAEGMPLLRPHVPEWRTLVWVDSLYHVPSGLVSAGVLLGREDLVARGIDVAASALQVLRTPHGTVGRASDTGLERGTGVPWTRGIGWALLGLLDVCRLAPEAATEAGFNQDAHTLLRSLKTSQRDHGQWPTVLASDEADDETFVAGFWLASAHHTVAPKTDHHVSRRALKALLSQVRDDGVVAGVSHDTHVRWGVEPYLHPPMLPPPWGQGAALRGLAATLTVERARYAGDEA